MLLCFFFYKLENYEKRSRHYMFSSRHEHLFFSLLSQAYPFTILSSSPFFITPSLPFHSASQPGSLPFLPHLSSILLSFSSFSSPIARETFPRKNFGIQHCRVCTKPSFSAFVGEENVFPIESVVVSTANILSVLLHVGLPYRTRRCCR